METKKVWFITGASKGLGLALAKKLLTEGYRVAATSRTIRALETAVSAESAEFLPLALNISDEADVRKAFDATIAKFGRIDVVVNNAGYGQIGAIEELSDAESRQNFDVNVFGLLNINRNVLPHLRAQKSGLIFNISSIGGFSAAFPGFGIYCATKFAVHAISESLAHELAPFGIHSTLVLPGYFRTNFLSEGSILTPETEIAGYDNVRETQAAHQNGINANQPGDPEKAADVLIAIAAEKNPPVHLFLGPDAYKTAKEKIEAVETDMESWETLATSTNFTR